MRNTVHSLISSSADLTSLSDEFLAADSGRYINVFDTHQKRKQLLGSLVTDAGVGCVSLHRSSVQKSPKKGGDQISSLTLLQKQVLAAVTEDGTVELFAGPFHQFRDPQTSSNAQGSLKSKGKSRTRRADAVVRVVRPDKAHSAVPVVSASFHGSDLVIAWVEGGANLLFHRIRWQEDDGSEGLALRGEVEVVKAKVSSLPGSAMVNGAKDIGKSHVDETHAVVEQGGMAEGLVTGSTQQDAILLSSDAEDNNNEDATSQSESEEPQPVESAAQQPSTKKANEDVEMADAAGAEEEEEEGHGEPSFGELLRANNASEPIDVEATLGDESKADSGAASLVPVASKHNNTSLDAAAAPSGLTLATVLTQSLKTNDNALLESCFHSTDMNVVRATIQRIDSALATNLLQKLAERLASRPGRYGHLLVWVQWTCVAHGGAIAGRPDILQQMTSLFKVMDQRSASLSPLLLLKGKLDMLDAQLGLRQGVQQDGGGVGRRGTHSEDEEDVVYVEGQEEEEVESNKEDAGAAGKSAKIRLGKSGGLGAEDEEDEDMPLVVNGVASDEEEEEEDLVDDEAELSADEDDVSDDEEEDEDEDEDEDEEEDDQTMEPFVADSADESDISIDAAKPVASPAVSKGDSKTKNKAKKAGKR